MKKFTKNEVQDLRAKLNRVLAEFGEANDMDLSIGNIKFGEQVTTKLTVQYKQDLAQGEFPETKESNMFIKRSNHIGIDKSLLHKSFKYQGDEVRLVGYNSRAPKNCMLFEINGRPYKSGLVYFKSMLKENASAYLI